MADRTIGDYFISDADDAFEDDDVLNTPVVVPAAVPSVAAEPVTPTVVTEAAPVVAPAPPSPPEVQPPSEVQTTAAAQPAVVRPSATVGEMTREQRLAQALDRLMHEDPDIQAAALVSLDGFTMASALPDGMQADRVGAMSAAILGLGERAAAELGRGHLSQVFIEGEGGYVLLVAAGDRAVLTVMASPAAKLGLVLYDMKETAGHIGEILS